jgi:hypothetical protein
VRFEVFTSVAMKNGVIWDVTPCGSYKNLRFGGKYHFLHQGDKNEGDRNNVRNQFVGGPEKKRLIRGAYFK